LLPFGPEPFVFHLVCCLHTYTLEYIKLTTVFCGLESWYLALMGEHKLRVFQNRVLRRIFRLKCDDATGGSRKMQYEDLHNVYTSPSILYN
jgi:hypothetical protein